jgi:hypothetical protein
VGASHIKAAMATRPMIRRMEAPHIGVRPLARPLELGRLATSSGEFRLPIMMFKSLKIYAPQGFYHYGGACVLAIALVRLCTSVARGLALVLHLVRLIEAV